MDIDKMGACRELDGLVAEEVMGWHNITRWLDGEISGRHEETDYQLLELPHYSTDIAAAWEVVEKLKMTVTPNTAHPRIRWIADVELKGKQDLWLAGAETAPLAICRAALKAVGCSVS